MQTTTPAPTLERFSYNGYSGCQSFCQVAIQRTRGRDVIWLQEDPKNTGTSITNKAETIVNTLVKNRNLNPDRLVVIEHYPARGHLEPSWRLVQMSFANGNFHHPRWSDINEEAAVALFADHVPFGWSKV